MAYTKKEFKKKYFSSKELCERWNATVSHSMHFRQKTASLTDRHYQKIVQNFLKKNVISCKDKKILKLDLYNEATGTSHTGFFLKERGSVIGIDIADKISLQAHKKMGHDLSAIVGDIRFLPFRPNSFDIVFSIGTLEHVQTFDQPAVIDEIHRILKPGGQVLLGVNNRFSLWLTPLLFEGLEYSGLTRRHWSYEPTFKPSHLKNLLKDRGFINLYTSGTYLLPKFLRVFDMWTHERMGSFWDKIEKYKIRTYRPILHFLEWLENKELLANFSEQTISIGFKIKKENVE